MSTAARDEAIDIVAEALEDARHNQIIEDDDWKATQIVDKLLETHAIVRRAPRVHRPTRQTIDRRPILQRILEGGPS